MFKKLFSETIIYGVGAILPRIIIFLLNPFYINYINAGDFSKFTNLYAIISFVNIVLTFGFETAFFRFVSDEKSRKNTLNTAYWFLAINATVFLLLTLLFRHTIADFLNYTEHPEYITWFAFIAFLDTLCVIPFAWLRHNNMPIKYSAVRLIQSIFQTIFVIALFLWIPTQMSLSWGLNENVAYPFFSNLAGSSVGVVLLLPIALKVRFRFDFELFKKMLRYSYPIMLAGFAFMINENFDKALQRNIISDIDAGAYGGCYKLAVIMTLFVTAYRMGIEPFFFKQMNKNDSKKTYADVTEYFVIFASVAALGIIANISWLKTLLVTDSSYWVAIDIVPIIVLANLFFGVYYNLSTWYKVTDRTLVGTWISWGGAIITLLLNIILLPKFGFMVSAWATFAAYLFMMVFSYLLGQKYYPIPYKKRKIIILLTLTLLFSYLSYAIFAADVWISNVLFLVYLSFILFIEKDKLAIIRNKIKF